MGKHTITLTVDSQSLFDAMMPAQQNLHALAVDLSTVLLTGEQPGLIDAIRLAVWGITVESSPTAAPDLLEAARKMVARQPYGQPDDGPLYDEFQALRAALSKAEGRSLSSASGQEGDHG